MHFDYAQCKQKGFVPILIVLLIVVVLGTGGYLVYKHSQTKLSVPTPQPTTSSTPQPSPSPINETANPDSIGANWKTYTNTEFSFKYPNNVTPQELNDQYTDVSVNFKYPGPPDGCELCDGYLLAFKSGKLSNQSLKQIAEKTLKEKEGYGSITQALKSVSINNYSGLTFSYTVQVATTEIYLSDGKGNYIEIRKSIDDPQKRGYEKIIDQILSTFKFQ